MFGYCGYILITLSWVKVGTNIRLHPWQKKLGKAVTACVYLSIAIFLLTVVLIIITRVLGSSRILYLISVSSANKEQNERVHRSDLLLFLLSLLLNRELFGSP